MPKVEGAQQRSAVFSQAKGRCPCFVLPGAGARACRTTAASHGENLRAGPQRVSAHRHPRAGRLQRGHFAQTEGQGLGRASHPERQTCSCSPACPKSVLSRGIVGVTGSEAPTVRLVPPQTIVLALCCLHSLDACRQLACLSPTLFFLLWFLPWKLPGRFPEPVG